MPRVYEKIKSHLCTSKTIHIIGTNGKGTTGRFLATALHSLGWKTGHYTSPHILEFNERIWLSGNNVSNEQLDEAHQKLLSLLSLEDVNSLSYFEYTTFLAMMLFIGCDFVVLEAGLGGEHDATAVFSNELTLVTPIDIDHEAFLGNTIKEIATTKLNAIQKNAILASQKFEEVQKIAAEICLKKIASLHSMDELLDENDTANIQKISQTLKLAPYLQDNLKLSVSALKFLGMHYNETHLKNAKLFGRLSKIDENVFIDVGHNPLAAASLLNALEGEKYILIYNSYKDKNYQEILRILKPIIRHVEIIDVTDNRIESKQTLQKVLTDLEIKYKDYKERDPRFLYLVFGSFSVVEAFLREYYE
ncbi:bifunctional folylpolyglutamate synthase/dihydrofolate synthase [bacterium]|nr:bifunctional folylpolyglutamate synthase/dihydrofolate synthase [bacterium]MBU1993151.1 bifunctional folylpolyglutamate synthase/dihydrofolate synthase [bacterium]